MLEFRSTDGNGSLQEGTTVAAPIDQSSGLWNEHDSSKPYVLEEATEYKNYITE